MIFLFKSLLLLKRLIDSLGQFGVLTIGLMMGMVLFDSLDPDSDLSVDRDTIAPTERRRLPEETVHMTMIDRVCFWRTKLMPHPFPMPFSWSPLPPPPPPPPTPP